MLTLLLGDFGSGKTTYLCREIAALVNAENPPASFLIVPEQATVTTESTMAAILPETAPLSFEVSNFSRLANTALRRVGGIAHRAASKDDKLFLMWRVLRECAPLLKEKVDIGDAGQIARYVAAIDEMRIKGISMQTLRRAKDELTEDFALQRKLSDFLVVENAYRSCFSDDMTDAGDDITRLSEIITHNSPFVGAHFFFDGFVSFTAQETAVLRALLATADMTVALAVPAVKHLSLAYTEIADTARTLKDMAEELQIAVRVLSQKETYRPKPPVFHHIAKNLFSSVDAPAFEEKAPAKPPITITELSDIFAESDYIASEISRLVQSGLMYRDILLVGRNPEAYHGILDAALKKNGIPFYFSKKTDITAYEPIKFILSVYRMRTKNFRTEDVISYLKCGFSGVSRQVSDEMESYATTWRIHGNTFFDARPWTLHPRGYTDRPLTEAENNMLAELNEARATISRTLTYFGGAPKTRTVLQHATALVSFLEAVNMEKELGACALRAKKEGRRIASADYEGLYKTICDVLDRLVALLGTLSIREDEFAALLDLAFSSVQMGQIPTSVDEVVIGDASMLRQATPACTIMFGVNDGIFPGNPIEKSFFNEGELRTLMSHGVPAKAERIIAPARERYTFLRAFLSPKDQLIITVPRANRGLSPLYPAPVIQEIKKLGGDFVACRFGNALPPFELLWTRRAALDALGNLCGKKEFSLLHALVSEDSTLLPALKRMDIPLVDPFCHLSPPNDEGAQCAKKTPLALTQSRIESFVNCPFSYTCNHLLRLQENLIADFRSSETGSFVHALFERFFLLLSKENKSIHDIPLDEREKLVELAAEECIDALFPDVRFRSNRLLHLCRRLTAYTLPAFDSISKEFGNSSFTPRFFELSIGRQTNGKDDPFCLADGTPLSLYGRVDRVDVCTIEGKQYVRVVDYKTGTKEFRPENIKKGIDIQMLLYLSILCDEKETELRKKLGLDEQVFPAGILYFQTKRKELKTTSSDTEALREAASLQIQRSGILLNDDKVLSAMEADSTSSLLNLRKKKDQYTSVSGTTLATDEEFKKHFDTLHQTVVRIGEAIHGGEASAISLNQDTESASACRYCAFKPVCRNTKVQSTSVVLED